MAGVVIIVVVFGGAILVSFWLLLWLIGSWCDDAGLVILHPYWVSQFAWIPLQVNFLLSTYEFIVVAKPNREFVFFMFTVVSITINIVFGILMPPREDLDDQYVRLDEVRDYTVLEVSDEDYYHYYQCSDCDEDDNKYGSDGYYGDDEDDVSDDDVNSDDFYGEKMDSEEFQRRAEEFIAKNTRKWREEFIYEKLEYMAAIE